MNKFILGSGFYGGQKEREFAELWSKCLLRYLTVKPELIAILTVGESDVSRPSFGRFNSEWVLFPQRVRLLGNNGHVGQLIAGEKPGPLCGWSSALMWLCLTAYANESSLLFVEQDCLVFGDFYKQMMEDLGDGMMVFGRKMKSEPFMHCGNSLIYIRHEFLLTFVKDYIGLGTDGDTENVPETKFRKIEMMHPDKIRRLSFGCDREKPIPFDGPVVYCQKLTDDELEEFRKRGRL